MKALVLFLFLLLYVYTLSHLSNKRVQTIIVDQRNRYNFVNFAKKINSCYRKENIILRQGNIEIKGDSLSLFIAQQV